MGTLFLTELVLVRGNPSPKTVMFARRMMGGGGRGGEGVSGMASEILLSPRS